MWPNNGDFIIDDFKMIILQVMINVKKVYDYC